MRAILAALVLAALSASAQTPSTNDSPAGQALADKIRSSIPEESTNVHAALIIHGGGQTRTVPLVCRVIVHGDTWETDYDCAATTNSGAERLVVIHRLNATNEYRYARAASPVAPLPALEEISPAQAAATPLAGSDYSLGDLGLDFLHWPQQRQMQGEIHLSQPCYVLESRDPAAEGIVKVTSYVDEDNNGLLIADGYDAQGRKVKEFSLGGGSVKKVNGHYQLEKVGMKNLKNHSHTELKYDTQE